MKFLAIVLLAAVAYAEPAAESDPALFYSGYNAAFPYYNRFGYSAAYVAPSVYNYGVSPYYNNFGYRYFAKRDAESDPKADPALFYGAYNAFPYYNNWAGYSAYAPAAYNTYAYSAFPYYNNFGYRYIAKRDAESDPKADPALFYSNAYSAFPYYNRFGYSAYNAFPYTYGYNRFAYNAFPYYY